MDDSTGTLPGLSPVAGKPAHVAFDGGQMTFDAGILLLAAIEQRLGIAEQLPKITTNSPTGRISGRSWTLRADLVADFVCRLLPPVIDSAWQPASINTVRRVPVSIKSAASR